MSLQLYDAALESPDGPEIAVLFEDGHRELLEVARWSADPDLADESLLDRAAGPVLDVGCGPGRMVAALAGRGIEALGLDLSAAAVRLTRSRGAAAIRCDVLAGLPLPGMWRQILLIDGNIGIGGCPAELLLTLSRGLAAGGDILVELSPPGVSTASVRARLEPLAGRPGEWFPWALLGAADIGPVAAAAGLRSVETWEVDGRWFARLLV